MNPALFTLLTLSSPSFAQEQPAPPEQQVLLQRLAELEARLAELEAEKAAALASAPPDAALAAPTTPEAPEAPEAPVPPIPPVPPIATQGGGLVVAADASREGTVSFGGPVDVFGVVDGDVVSMGGAVRVHDGGVVDGSVVSVGGDVWVDGGAVVEGDAVSIGGRVHVDPEGEVGGDQVAAGPGGELPLGASVLGVDRRVEIEDADEDEGWSALGWLHGLVRRFSLGLAFAGAGVLLVGIWPRQVARVGAVLPGNLLWYGLAGAILAAALSVTSALFAVTIIGLPLSLLVLGLLAAGWMLGLVALCTAVGERMPWSQGKGAWAAFLVGAGLLAAITFVPWLGVAVVMALGFPALGAALMTRFGTRVEA